MLLSYGSIRVPIWFIPSQKLELEKRESCSPFYAYSLVICIALASLAGTALSHAAQGVAEDFQDEPNGSTTAASQSSFFPDCESAYFFMTLVALLLSNYKHSVLLQRLKKSDCWPHLFFLLGKAVFDHGVAGLLCVLHCVNPDQMPAYMHGLLACWIVSECVKTSSVDAFNPRVVPVVHASCCSPSVYVSDELWARSRLALKPGVSADSLTLDACFVSMSAINVATVFMLSVSFSGFSPILMYAYSCLGQMEGEPNHLFAWAVALTSYPATFLTLFRLFQPGKRSMRRVIALFAQLGQNACGGVVACMSPFPWLGVCVVTLMHSAACRPAHEVFLPGREVAPRVRTQPHATEMREIARDEQSGGALGAGVSV